MIVMHREHSTEKAAVATYYAIVRAHSECGLYQSGVSVTLTCTRCKTADECKSVHGLNDEWEEVKK